MAFPYTTIADFEDGTLGHFDSETDTNSALDFPHYTDLARTPGLPMPYRGAYCLRVDLATATTDGAWLQETASWNCTVNTEDIYIRIKFWLSPDAAMSDSDVVKLIALASAGATEAVGAVQYTTANGWRIGIGETAPTSFASLTLGEWHDFEIYANVHDATNGTVDGWLDGAALTQVTGLTHATLTNGTIGANPGAAFTPTAGTLLIDQVIASQTDDTSARIGSGGRRFPETLLLNKSGHAFVGHGILDNVSLYSGAGTDCVLQIWDTDTADTTNGALKLVLKNLTANETPVDPAGVPITLVDGCYVSLAGTNPQAMLNIRRAVGYNSDGAIRAHAFRR